MIRRSQRETKPVIRLSYNHPGNPTEEPVTMNLGSRQWEERRRIPDEVQTRLDPHLRLQVAAQGDSVGLEWFIRTSIQVGNHIQECAIITSMLQEPPAFLRPPGVRTM
ncbi:Uncharacterized protein DAT39_020712 [Clarias magur]|uniref:Uncharacterized protein n=1 Tax=Clarias magur TaxID=1594786 RepID=A0A8J4WR59_CLAMG|nr:Uncharacterized protein DAT39_020712 [Clarias magur]